MTNYKSGHVYLTVDQKDQICDTQDLRLFTSVKIKLSWNRLTFELETKPPIFSLERWLPGFVDQNLDPDLRESQVLSKSNSSSSFGRRKRILQPQNGFIASGTVTAIMGLSGAGKSTLLNCVTGWQNTGVGGKVTVTCPINKKNIKVSLVPQHDLLFGNFTIQETLLFASKIKNPSNTDHDMKVKKVLAALNLSEVPNNKVSKCSGGQIKKLSIGVELISSPDVLILDEPTSGLDSVSAEICIRLLIKLAAESRTAIVVTIHQPNFLIFNLFTNVYLLSKFGSLIYFGPPDGIKDHFEKFNVCIPSEASPCDFALQIASRPDQESLFQQLIDYYDHENITRSSERPSSSKQSISNSKKSTSNQDYELDDLVEGGYKILPVGKVVSKNSNDQVSWMNQILVLSWRSLQVSCFRSSRLVTKVLINIIVLLILTDVYDIKPGVEDGCLLQNHSNKTMRDALYEDLMSSKSGFANSENMTRNLIWFDDRIPDIINGINFQYACIVYLLLVYSIGSVLFTPFEIRTTIKEMRNSWYSVTVYMVSKTVSELPSLLISMSVTIVITYFRSQQIMIFWRFTQFALIFIIFVWVCDSFGMMIGVLINDMISAILVTMAFTLPNLIYSGFLIKFEHMSWYHRIISFTSFVRFAFEACLLTIYGYDRCEQIPTGVDLKMIEDEYVNQKLEDAINTMLIPLNLDSKTIYKFGNLIDIEKSCFASVINNSFEFFGLFDDTTAKNLLNVNNRPDEKNLPIISSYVLDFYNIEESILLRNISILLAMGFLFRLVAFLAILRRKRQSSLR